MHIVDHFGIKIVGILDTPAKKSYSHQQLGGINHHFPFGLIKPLFLGVALGGWLGFR